MKGQKDTAKTFLTEEEVDRTYEKFVEEAPEALKEVLRQATPERRREFAQALSAYSAAGVTKNTVDNELRKIKDRVKSLVDESDIRGLFADAVASIQERLMLDGSKITAFNCVAKVVVPGEDGIREVFVGGGGGNIVERRPLILGGIKAALKLLKLEMGLDRDEAMEMIEAWLRYDEFEARTTSMCLQRTAEAIAKELHEAGVGPDVNPARSVALGKVFALQNDGALGAALRTLNLGISDCDVCTEMSGGRVSDDKLQ